MAGGWRRAVLPVIFLSLSACAYAPQTVSIRPEVKVSDFAAVVGRERPVVFILSDERNREAVGRRHDAGGSRAPIVTAPDFLEVMGATLRQELEAQGLDLRLRPEPGLPVLRVAVRGLNYEAKNNILIGAVVTVSAAVAVRTGGDAGDFERLYRSTKSETVYSTPTTDWNETVLTAVTSDALRQAFADPELGAALTNCRRVTCEEVVTSRSAPANQSPLPSGQDRGGL